MNKIKRIHFCERRFTKKVNIQLEAEFRNYENFNRWKETERKNLRKKTT